MLLDFSEERTRFEKKKLTNELTLSSERRKKNTKWFLLIKFSTAVGFSKQTIIFYAWLMVNDTCKMDVVPVLHSHVIVEISWNSCYSVLPCSPYVFPTIKRRCFCLGYDLDFWIQTLFVSHSKHLLHLAFVQRRQKHFLNFELFSENHKPICYNIRMRNINCNINS